MTKVISRAAIIAIVTVVAVTAWLALSPRQNDTYAKCRPGQVAGGTVAIGGPFTLVDQTGRTVTDADVITKPTLLYFGYTFCPDVCPVDMARNAEAVDILEERGVDAAPVFISVDPARDKPDVLAGFVGNLHPRMTGLTGSEEQIRKAAAAYKVYFNIPGHNGDDYLVDHSTFTYLVLPRAGFVDFFRREETADQIADRVACFAGES